MNAMELRGIIPAMVTPLREDESVNIEELRNQVNRQIEAGAEALGVAKDCANVKATTTERMGYEGREEGISAQAVVLLTKGSV